MNSKPARVASPIPPIFPSTSPSTSPASHRRAKRPRRARVPSSPGLNRRRAMALASPASRPLRKQHARAHHVSLARRIPIDRSTPTRSREFNPLWILVVRLSDCPIVRLSDRPIVRSSPFSPRRRVRLVSVGRVRHFEGSRLA